MVILVIEIFNLLNINNKKAILQDDQIQQYLDNELIKDEILVLIPAYNEESTLQNAIETASASGNTLVIDDGSTDNTQQIALKYADHLISHRKNLGLAQAILHGIEYALDLDFKYMVIFDADGQYTGNDLNKVLKIIQFSNYDLVMGTRLEGEIEQMPLLKRFGNWVFSKSLTYITRIPISDGQTGLRAFSSGFASSIQLRGTFTYTQEMIFEAAKHRALVVETPIEFKKRQDGISRLMRGPIDYAIRAWALNLQIIAEYNPMKFAVVMDLILVILSFVTLNQNYNIAIITMVILFSIFAVIFQIGLFASIIIRKIDRLHREEYYEILETSKSTKGT